MQEKDLGVGWGGVLGMVDTKLLIIIERALTGKLDNSEVYDTDASKRGCSKKNGQHLKQLKIDIFHKK